MLNAVVYRKALRLKSVSAIIGDIVTIQSSHVQRVVDYFDSIPLIPVIIITILGASAFLPPLSYLLTLVLVVVVVLLYRAIGYVAALSSFAVIILLGVPYPTFTLFHINTLQEFISTYTERRISLINEVPFPLFSHIDT